jgi:gluconate 2-dehydrogenase gamma chain
MSESISRRNLLRGLSISAFATSGAGLVTLQAAQQAHDTVSEEKKASGGPYVPKAFNEHEYKTLEHLSDLIIPADEHSPGALTAGAADWIDFMASNCPELREIFTGGIAWVDHEMQRRYGADFLDAKPEQQTAMLDVIGMRKNAMPENEPGIHFFNWARNLVLDAYYTSPTGIKELGYMGNTAVSEFHVPEEALQYALKRSPFA